MPFIFKELEISGLIVIEPKIFPDKRGFFMESYKESEFIKNGIEKKFIQDNLSKSSKGILRGLHFQNNPKAQGKLIQVVLGRVWDVAVDLREESSTYLKWIGIELNDTEKKMFYIPPGFAHGFVALSDEVLFQYKCTNEYDMISERGIRWDDPDIGITWPVKDPLVSDRDKELPLIREIS